MSRIEVSWRGEAVGFMEEPISDMWYLEGRWVPVEGPKTAGFIAATKDLVAEKSIDEGAGVLVELTEDGGKPVTALVMNAPGQTIFVRQVFDERAKEFLRARKGFGCARGLDLTKASAPTRPEESPDGNDSGFGEERGGAGCGRRQAA